MADIGAQVLLTSEGEGCIIILPDVNPVLKLRISNSPTRSTVDIDVSTVLSQNITLVYDSLDLQAIDSRKLKALITGAQPMVMDSPNMIVALYPPTPLIIQFGDKRIRITLQRESKDIGGIPLWEIALKCHQLAPGQSQLVAYGFNYDVGLAVADGDAEAITIDLFVSNRRMIEDVLEGRLSSFVPRLRFKRDETLYDLVLEPIDEKRIKAHLNTHFEFEGITFPSSEQLEASFRQEFDYLVSMLLRLLGGDK